jgi:indole-3-glycerol phosphate synthase
LKTFQVDLANSFELIKYMDKSIGRISESGIDNPESIKELKSAGFNGFLIGEIFMKTTDPGLACKEFIQKI